MADPFKTLLTNQTANGSGPEVVLFGGWHQVYVTGTFDGASVTIEVKDPGGTLFLGTGPKGVITTAEMVLLFLPRSGIIRATLASAGASTDLNAKVY